jgi:hypothetical protein
LLFLVCGRSSKPKSVKWSSAPDALLIAELKAQGVGGNQTDSASWKSDAWTAVRRALEGSEQMSRGCSESKSAYLTRWTKVCAIFICYCRSFASISVTRRETECGKL